MKTMYVVEGDSLIDGGAPGYFAVAFFDNKEDADTLCEILNKYRKEFMKELSSDPNMKEWVKTRAWGEKQKKINRRKKDEGIYSSYDQSGFHQYEGRYCQGR